MSQRAQALHRIAVIVRGEQQRYEWLAQRHDSAPKSAARCAVFRRMADVKAALAEALAPDAKATVNAEEFPTLSIAHRDIAAAEDRLLRLIEATFAIGESDAVRSALKRYVPQIQACQMELLGLDLPSTENEHGGSSREDKPRKLSSWLRFKD